MRFWSLQGEVPYLRAEELQRQLVELRAADQIEDTVLLLEHTPVITQGRGLQSNGQNRPRHMPAPEVLPENTDFVQSGRGGDLTYHGPGQLVVYPILSLKEPKWIPPRDIHSYIRWLEELWIRVLKSYQVNAQVRSQATGVWIGDRKIISIGVAVRKWVTYHGAAVNVVNNLRPFNYFSPCGFQPEVMTRLADWASLSGQWRAEMEERLVAEWAGAGAQVESLTFEEALKQAGAST